MILSLSWWQINAPENICQRDVPVKRKSKKELEMKTLARYIAKAWLRLLLNSRIGFTSSSSSNDVIQHLWFWVLAQGKWIPGMKRRCNIRQGSAPAPFGLFCRVVGVFCHFKSWDGMSSEKVFKMSFLSSWGNWCCSIQYLRRFGNESLSYHKIQPYFFWSDDRWVSRPLFLSVSL